MGKSLVAAAAEVPTSVPRPHYLEAAHTPGSSDPTDPPPLYSESVSISVGSSGTAPLPPMPTPATHGPSYPLPAAPSHSGYGGHIRYETTGEDEIVSYDPVLNRDADVLTAFILENRGPPQLLVEVKGFHLEDQPHVMGHHSGRNEDAGYNTDTHGGSRVVIDFQTKLDISPFIAPEPAVFVRPLATRQTDAPIATKDIKWSAASDTTPEDVGASSSSSSRPLATGASRTLDTKKSLQVNVAERTSDDSDRPSLDDPQRDLLTTRVNPPVAVTRTVRDVAAEYVARDRYLKELVVEKVVMWDLEKVRRDLERVFRDRGYRHHLRVTFINRRHRIHVRSPNTLMRLYHNCWVRTFLYITCLWILVMPVMWILNYRGTMDDEIKLDYAVQISPEEFLERNRFALLDNLRFA
ncbi:hypothetical protein IWQ60_006872 [Tieghemiomyces parasiticus]|uniref:Transmembrane protein n=1 Tax=Tieghemiomyces parasiticus TaxID=78921 RepID=A0A9W8A9H1_9FUNG|nr:hypothetical protein IWQ60_006872 [Tieghemiomyces parasiticus]